MPRITIDQQPIDVPAHATILEAAAALGIRIPTLCYRQDCEAPTSCLVCVVKLVGSGRFVPACGTRVADGMEIESETEEVRRMRRSAIELLLGDHLGDCLGPCELACPAQMDIPLMLRQIAAGAWRDAIETVKRDIALPAVLGRICPAPCEKACRRGPAGGPVAICALKRLVADLDLQAAEPYRPDVAPPSGRRVAVLGAGPTGLAATYALARAGHACTVFDAAAAPGGRLRRETTETQLPPAVLDAEVRTLLLPGVELRLGSAIDAEGFSRLRSEFDAVLLAVGAPGTTAAIAWGLPGSTRGIATAARTFATPLPGVFAAGSAVRGKALVIRSVADGKEAAAAIDQFLSGRPVVGALRPFNTRIGRVDEDELRRFLAGASPEPRREPQGGTTSGYTPEEGAREASRCLHCDCRKKDSCRLRDESAALGAPVRRAETGRRAFEQDASHRHVVYEPGKCIACGLCVAITRRAGEPLGLTFIGRGFDVRVGVPLGGSLSDALTRAADQVVEACPTGALAWKDVPR